MTTSSPVLADHLLDGLAAAGISGVSGVPCSILDPLIHAAGQRADLGYVPASVEGEAVAISAGQWLGGGAPGVCLMQNSGLGNTVNPLTSLIAPYRIPMVLVVSWRGEPGRPDAPHHGPMGAVTPGLLDLLGIPRRFLDEAAPAELAQWAVGEASSRGGAVAIVIRKGTLAGPDDSPPPPTSASRPSVIRFEGTPTTRGAVIDALRAAHPHRPLVSTTGHTSRVLAERWPEDHHLYMQGSMGFAPAVALGVARATDKRVTVLDGDGALVMRMGSLATIGALAPAGFLHIVMDNGAYASTGGQPAVRVDLAAVAAACGYAGAISCEGAEHLDAAFEAAKQVGGPCLLRVATRSDEAPPKGRPAALPHELGARFRAAVGGAIRGSAG